MRALRIHEAATDEAAEVAAWYEKERPGLGTEYEHAVDAALDLLEEDIVPLVSMPGAAGRRGVKRLILRRFPYSVIVQAPTAREKAQSSPQSRYPTLGARTMVIALIEDPQDMRSWSRPPCPGATDTIVFVGWQS